MFLEQDARAVQPHFALAADTAAALKQPDVRTKFLDQGAEPVGQDTAATASFIKDEERRWRDVIKSANVTLE